MLAAYFDFFRHPRELFGNVRDAKFAIRGVLRAFFGETSTGGEDFLSFKKIKVRFEDSPEFDLDFDYRRRIFIFIIKVPEAMVWRR